MNLINILLKEYEMANDRYKFYSEIKTKFFGFFITFSLVFLTFLVKGDLPPSMYLLLAGIIFVFMFFHTYLVNKQVTAWLLWHYLEKKINSFIKKNRLSDELLDFGTKTLYMAHGEGHHTLANRITRYLIILVFLMVYEFCILNGARAVSQDFAILVAIHAAFYVVLLIFATTNYIQNKVRKSKYKEIIAELNSETT